MKNIFKTISVVLLSASCTLAYGQVSHLTTNAPDCRMPDGKILPEKYQNLAKRHKGYAWALQAALGDGRVSGNGSERVDGSGMFDFLDLFRADLNNDGYCDWFIHDGAPLSTGGDRDSINTLYLGQKNGWLRIGATIPNDKPDELGQGKATDEQKAYLFGEEIGIIHDTAGRINYVITAFYDRNVNRDFIPGYRILVWDADKKNLRPLDKWQPGSKAADVYAFFKAHGAQFPAKKKAGQSSRTLGFDPDIEAYEIEQACDPQSAQRSGLASAAPLSRYLTARCKH